MIARLLKAVRRWVATAIRGPVVRCRCGHRRSRAHRCPDCGQLVTRVADGHRPVRDLPARKFDNTDPLNFDFDA